MSECDSKKQRCRARLRCCVGPKGRFSTIVDMNLSCITSFSKYPNENFATHKRHRPVASFSRFVHGLIENGSSIDIAGMKVGH